MAHTARYALDADTGRAEALVQLAQELEENHNALERTARIMNLPTWAGHLDAVLLDHGPLPENHNPAHAGDLLSATARAQLLATLIEEGPGDREEILHRFQRDRSTLCPVGCRMLADAGYIIIEPQTKVVSAHPALSTDMATIEVHCLERPTPTDAEAILQFAHKLHWQGHDLTPPGHTPLNIPAYLNAVGRALEAEGNGEHPDIGPPPQLREGWHNALNIR